MSVAAVGCTLLDLTDLQEGASSSTAMSTSGDTTGDASTARDASAAVASSVAGTGGGGTGGAGGGGGGPPISTHTVVVAGGRATTTMPEDTIFTATIADDGSLAPFAVQQMPFVRQNHGIAAVGGRLFVIGGYGEVGDTPDIQLAQIGPGATFEAWQTNVSPLPMAFGRFGLAVRGGDVYITGGRPNSAGTYTDGVYRATATGDLLSQPTEIESLPTAKSDVAAVIVGDRLVVIGGAMTGDVSLDEVTAYPIDPTGGLGVGDAWPTLTVPRAQHCAATTSFGGSDWIYVVGGQSATSMLVGSIEVTRIDGSSIQPWAVTTELFPPRRALACAALGTSLYIIGGVPGSTASTAEVMRVELDPTNGLPVALTLQPPLPAARAFMPALILAQ